MGRHSIPDPDDSDDPVIDGPDVEGPEFADPDVEGLELADPDVEDLEPVDPDVVGPDVDGPDADSYYGAAPDVPADAGTGAQPSDDFRYDSSSEDVELYGDASVAGGYGAASVAGGYGADPAVDRAHDVDPDAAPDVDPDADGGFRADYRDDFRGGDYRDQSRGDYRDDPEFSDADYPDYPGDPTYGGAFASDDADSDATVRLRRTDAGGHRSGEDFGGGHRGGEGRRGVSIGVIVALVTVVVVVAGVIAWRLLGNSLSDRSVTAADRCVDGDVAVEVVADPTIAEQIGGFADRYNDAAGPIGDRCPTVTVRPADPAQVLDGLVGTWPADLGTRPALWVPASSVSAARLAAATGEASVGTVRSLATSPVLLAVRPELRAALVQQSWATLPQLQTAPDSMAGIGLPDWGSLRLATPVTGSADASYLVAEAVAGASAPAGAAPAGGLGAVSALLAGAPELPDGSTNAALDALVAGQPAASAAHAVAVTEQQLYQRSTRQPDAAQLLAGWLPPGPAPTADYPTVELQGDWLSSEQRSGANAFADYLSQPDQLAELTGAGFRTGAGEPPANDVVAFAPVDPLAAPDNATRVQIADAFTAPAVGPAATVVVDTSMTTVEGPGSRLANVAAALAARLAALPPTSAVGLWAFDGTAGRQLLPTAPLSEPVGGQPRTDALATDLDGLSATSNGAVSFTTLRLVLTDALAGYRPDQPNSVLVITAGPHTDQTLDGPGLQDVVRDSVDPARPVAVNVIDFGDDPDRATWEAVAETSGGQYRNLATSDGPELASALAAMLA